MRIRFIRGTALGGVGNDAAPGEVRELPDSQARHLIEWGRAVAVDASETQQEPVPASHWKKGK